MATRLQPNSDVSRQMQDEASELFSQLFNGTRSDDMPAVQALALFYEFRELTPIGRRGDEMIRRLADRLAAVDLLDQAAELLQYQVEHRLDGSARAHVASRLAMIYLTNRKPDRALAALRATRIADLAGELRQQRLLLEARAQSDVGRHDLALDIIVNLAGREAIRLRSDIHWAARRWRESSEQIELLYGERWKQFPPLNEQEKSDIIRAAIGYSLSDDGIGLSRLKEKYAAKLGGDGDRATFEAATKLAATNSSEFATIARMAASVDTLDGFLREMKQRFPEMASRAPLPQAAKAKSDPNDDEFVAADSGAETGRSEAVGAVSLRAGSAPSAGPAGRTNGALALFNCQTAPPSLFELRRGKPTSLVARAPNRPVFTSGPRASRSSFFALPLERGRAEHRAKGRARGSRMLVASGRSVCRRVGTRRWFSPNAGAEPDHKRSLRLRSARAGLTACRIPAGAEPGST